MENSVTSSPQDIHKRIVASFLKLPNLHGIKQGDSTHNLTKVWVIV